MSLKGALEQLGFVKTYHMIELFMDPTRVVHWEAAADGMPVDWDTLFEGYQAAVDYPACRFYKELMAQYPDAKVILTVRSPESWYESASETIFKVSQNREEQKPDSVPVMGLPGDPALLARVFQLIRKDIWQGHFQGRFDDPEFAMGVFNRHNEEVKATVPPEKLLVFHPKDGWGPLCRFLDVPVPEGVPFPHLNDREEFRRRLQERQQS
jgi:hypothetical protein